MCADKAQEAILRAASVPETEDVDGLRNIKGASQESINQLIRAIQSRPVNFVELSPRHVRSIVFTFHIVFFPPKFFPSSYICSLEMTKSNSS